MINIRDLNLEEIETELLEMGEKKYRAKQIFAWLYRNIETFEEMTDLSKDLIKKLNEKFYIKNLEMINFQKSKDGTIKYLFQLNDGHAIESVIMKYKYGTIPYLYIPQAYQNDTFDAIVNDWVNTFLEEGL